jgi:hypothetical protein
MHFWISTTEAWISWTLDPWPALDIRIDSSAVQSRTGLDRRLTHAIPPIVLCVLVNSEIVRIEHVAEYPFNTPLPRMLIKRNKTAAQAPKGKVLCKPKKDLANDVPYWLNNFYLPIVWLRDYIKI